MIGTHRFSVGGVEEDRVLFPYTVWMFQRALDHYQGIAGPARARVDDFLAAHGGLAGLQTRLRRRVRRKRNLLVPV